MQKRVLYIAFLLLAICNQIVAEDQMTINDFSLSPGGSKEVSVMLTNEDTYVGFQFDLYLPDGITVESFSANGNRISEGTTSQMAQLLDGSYRFIAAALNGNPIIGSEGAVLTLTIKAGENVSDQDYQGYLRNVKISKADGSGVTKAEQSFTITVQNAEAEPYAVLSDNNTVLTFYYDGQKEVRGGIDINNSYIDYDSSSQYGSVTTAVIDASFADYHPTSTAYWFMECSLLTSIAGLENLKTDNVTGMRYMFASCINLENLDLSGLKTENVTDMSHMFDRCPSLTSLDLSNFRTDNVTDMSYMFEYCTGLTSLNVSSFNTANVTDMSWMFSNCGDLMSLDVSGFKTDNVTNMGSMFNECYRLTSLDVSGFKTDNVTNMRWMFCYCSGLTSLDLSGFNTQNVTNMYGMFYGCVGLTNLDVSGFNTANVTDMSWMFSNCRGLTSLDLSGFNTQNVTDMSCMFSGCNKLTSLDLSNFNTQNVTTMSSMFSGCSGLMSLDVSSFKTDNVTNMYGMFDDCYRLTSLDVTGFDTQNVTKMEEMFYSCSSLTSLDLSNFNTQNVTNMAQLFYGCSGLTSLDVTGFNTQNVTTMSSMFSGCSGLMSLDVSSFKTDNVTNMRFMFHGCSGLKTIYAGSEWSTTAVTKSTDMFNGCTNLVGGMGTVYDESHVDYTYARIDGGPNSETPGYFTGKNASVVAETCGYAEFEGTSGTLTFKYGEMPTSDNVFATDSTDFSEFDNPAPWDCSKITKVVFDSSFVSAMPISTAYWFHNANLLTEIVGIEKLNTSNVKNMAGMFMGCSGLAAIDVSHFNTEKVTRMGVMFYDCRNLTNLDLSSFNTSNVYQMGAMFSGCSGLISLNVSSFDTHNVSWMNFMFFGCSSLTSLEIGHFNTSNVRFMNNMFENCYSLTNIDVSHFDTSNVTEFEDMFENCYNLTSIDVSHFVTSKANYMSAMFSGCKKLEFVDVSNFTTTNISSLLYMFKGCSKLTTLDLSNFDTRNVTRMNDMFKDCTNLVSLNISNFDTSNVTEMGSLFGGCSSLAAIQAGSAYIPTNQYAQINNPNLLVYVNDASLAPENIQNVVVGGYAKTIMLTDVVEGNGNFYCPKEFKAEMISYTRNFQQQTEIGVSRGWESIALPFTVQTIMHEKNGVIAPFGNDASNKHFWLRTLSENGLAQATQIEANTPYIISMPNSDEYSAGFNQAGLVTFSSQDAIVPITEVHAVETSTADGEMIVLLPNFQRVSKDARTYALNVGEQRENYPEGSVFEANYRDIRPFEAYTVHYGNGPAPRFVPIANMSNGATNIEKVANNQQPIANGMYYDLSGRKLQQKPTRKGVYIQNGRRVVIK